jgi:hypothetical protein
MAWLEKHILSTNKVGLNGSAWNFLLIFTYVGFVSVGFSDNTQSYVSPNDQTQLKINTPRISPDQIFPHV